MLHLLVDDFSSILRLGAALQQFQASSCSCWHSAHWHLQASKSALPQQPQQASALQQQPPSGVGLSAASAAATAAAPGPSPGRVRHLLRLLSHGCPIVDAHAAESPTPACQGLRGPEVERCCNTAATQLQHSCNTAESMKASRPSSKRSAICAAEQVLAIGRAPLLLLKPLLLLLPMLYCHVHGQVGG